MLLVVALLLALHLQTAAAATPFAQTSLLAASMEPFAGYPDPEGILDTMCQLCGFSMDICLCAHAVVDPRHLSHGFSPSDFYGHPEWPQGPVPIPTLEAYEPSPAPPHSYLPEAARQRLSNAAIHSLNANATRVGINAVKAHIESTYTPGDRLARAAGRRPRQPPRQNGFPCPEEGCVKAFNRSCDLQRHQKTHLSRSERPHKCSVCHEGFLYPKDRKRHEQTHSPSTSAQAVFYCTLSGCTNVDGFSRHDNLLRHTRRQHPEN